MRTQQIITKANELVAKANEIYNINLPHINIEFNLRGKSAGQARFNPFTKNCTMRFNIDMVNNNGFDHILNETVPHELAHIICFYTGMDKGHGKTWKRVCMALGGTGERCHNEDVIPARITEQFAYQTTCGRIVKVGKIRHNKIQKGMVYKINTGGMLIRSSWAIA